VERDGSECTGLIQNAEAPPRTMKFSEIASNQSTRAVPASTSGKCLLRRPTP
jgi:hypothetical protein